MRKSVAIHSISKNKIIWFLPNQNVLFIFEIFPIEYFNHLVRWSLHNKTLKDDINWLLHTIAVAHIEIHTSYLFNWVTILMMTTPRGQARNVKNFTYSYLAIWKVLDPRLWQYQSYSDMRTWQQTWCQINIRNIHNSLMCCHTSLEGFVICT